MASSDSARAEPGLDVGRLRLLRAVARHGSIAAGARSLGLTPSAVSQQLAVLERETGAALLSRSPRGAVLTAAGEALAVRAGDVLGLLEQARAELDLLTGRVAGPVVVSTVASAAATLVAAAAAAVPADVDLRVSVAEPATSVAALLAGEADLAVVDEYDYVPWARPELGVPVELAVEPLFAVLPDARSWPRQVALTALADEPWVMPPDDAACGRAVRSACRAAGFEPRVAWETDDMWVLATTVAAGHGVTVLPRSAIAPAPGLRVRPLAAELARRVQLLTRPAAAGRPAVNAVRAAIIAAAG